MNNILEKMIKQLSGEDKKQFSQLASRLNEVDGDVSKLSEEEIKFISSMEDKYANKFSKLNLSESVEQEEATISENTDSVNADSVVLNSVDSDLLESGFAQFARQLLSRDLKEQFPKEDDAIKFAFQNKWLPQDFKDTESAEKIFLDFEKDICEANQWREEVVGVESDKRMAIGMTWFMVIYQLYHR